jgi:curved DNA-binding protein CbpA
MVPDPYKALDLPHSATSEQIKRSYRDLARRYHPDRYVGEPDSSIRDRATTRFAEVASAYALLSDPKRKAEYDHIYKYGGYDDEEDQENRQPPMKAAPQNSRFAQQHQNSQPNVRKRKSGVGYVCHDPLAFLWTQGRVRSRSSVIGCSIPNRLGAGAGSLRFGFSSGSVRADAAGKRTVKKQTTQFCQGKSYTRTETTTYYPDGRKEVVVEEEGNLQGSPEKRRYCTRTETVMSGEEHHEEQQLPWYVTAWHEIKDKLSMCTHPCRAVH